MITAIESRASPRSLLPLVLLGLAALSLVASFSLLAAAVLIH